MATQFAPILDRPPTEFDRPLPLPAGTYSTVIQGQPRYDKSAKKQTEFVEFTHKFISAGEDVDEEELTKALTKADGTTKNLTDVTMRNTFYITENSVWRLREFLNNCGLDANNADASLRELVEETPNQQVGVYVSHVPSQDGQSIFANITKTFAVE